MEENLRFQEFAGGNNFFVYYVSMIIGLFLQQLRDMHTISALYSLVKTNPIKTSSAITTHPS